MAQVVSETSTAAPVDSGGPQVSGPPESAREGPLYIPTDVTPEEIFQAIGRLRKEARDEIDRLIGFLDKTDDYVSRELEDAVDDSPCAMTNSTTRRTKMTRMTPPSHPLARCLPTATAIKVSGVGPAKEESTPRTSTTAGGSLSGRRAIPRQHGNDQPGGLGIR
jgi:hypothetical protein